MIARIQIPSGWRRLRAGETVVNGDMCFQRIAMEWMKLEGVVPTAGPVKATEYIIRRVKRKRAKDDMLRGYVPRTLCEYWDRNGDDLDVGRWRFESIKDGSVLTHREWLCRSDVPTWETRFWLRRGAR